jgi:hypothetical protein
MASEMSLLPCFIPSVKSHIIIILTKNIFYAKLLFCKKLLNSVLHLI